MPSKKKGKNAVESWTRVSALFSIEAPHLHGWLQDVESFSELRIKARDDGTFLAILKGFGRDGGPVVCFGVGYDVVLALLAVDSTIASGGWRVDKPWSPPKE